MHKINTIIIRLITTLLATFAVVGLFAQQRDMLEFKGKVTDQNNVPIIGAAVIVSGTHKGVSTDVDGKFVISTFPEATLQVSYLGFETRRVKLTSNTNVTIVLTESINKVDEVVVIGYGTTQKTKDVTGSIVNVPIDKIQDFNTTSLSETLSGLIPGLNVTKAGGDRPGESASISIRQNFDFSKDGGDNNPLIVIDDIIQSMSAFNSLNPADVESITVLRDGAAAIYGSRAAQGAIVVKTKRGENGKTIVNYSLKMTYSDAVSHPKTMSTYDYGMFVNKMLRTSKGDAAAAYMYSDDELNRMSSLDYNWLDEAWKPAVKQTHNLSLSGGSDKATYYASATYTNEGANLGWQDYNRWNFRTAIDVKVARGLKFSMNIEGGRNEQNKLFSKATSVSDGSYGAKGSAGYIGDYIMLAHMPSYMPWQVEIDGQNYYTSPSYGPYVLSNVISTTDIGGWNYFALNNSDCKSMSKGNSNRINLSLQYDVPYVKGLSAKVTYSMAASNSTSEEDFLPYTLASASNLTEVGHHLFDENTTYVIGDQRNRTRAKYAASTSRSSQFNVNLLYNRVFNNVHDVSVMASMERSESYSESHQQLYEGTDEYYQGTSASAGSIEDMSNTYFNKSVSGTLSYLASASYSYKHKYMFQALIRSDASTKFAPENYWGTFPNASVGWTVSEEPWFKNNIHFIDYFKFRASYGLTGKDNIKAWKWMQVYEHSLTSGSTFGTVGGQNTHALIPGASPNRNLTWDQCFKQNYGLDASFLGGRLSTGFDFYYQKQRNMVTSKASELGVPWAMGGAQSEENYGAVDAWGCELSVGWSDRIGDLRYNVSVNYAWSDNYVLKYKTEPVKYPQDNTTREGLSTIFPVWEMKVWRGTSTGDGMLRTDADIENYWAYLQSHCAEGASPDFLGITSINDMKKGMLVYQDVNGTLNEDGSLGKADGMIHKTGDQVKVHNQDLTYGFNTNIGLNWKGIQLNTQLSCTWGGSRYIEQVNQKVGNYMFWNREEYWSDMYDEVLNPDGKYPNLVYFSTNELESDFWSLPTLRLVIKHLTLAYNLPSKWAAKVHLGGVRVNVTGENLWDLYNPYPGKYRNMYNSATSYPTLRRWTMGLNITF